MNVENGEEASTGTTAITNVFVTDAHIIGDDTRRDSHVITVALEVTVGTVKIGVGGVHTSAYANPVGAKRIITVRNGNLYVKQGANGDKFVITTV